MKPPEVSRPGALPRGLRWAASICLVLSALTGMLSCNEASVLMEFEKHRTLQLERVPTLGLLGKDPAFAQRIVEAQLSAMEHVREPRVAVLTGLTLVCTLLFFASSRMLRAPDGMPREGFRQLIGTAGILAAVLRTIDGAQWTVVAQRTSVVMVEGFKKLPEFQDPVTADLLPVVPYLLMATSVLPTLLVAGGFALLAQYFRSEGVRDVIITLDGPTEDP
ncbi:hypothetical protein D7Y13_15325 [Corallococcus praedator]|uniref:DUF2975 domain-containing protein n=1 Tax=Corallococcus praedator TaxID=2316724 RepID=A0ABX9QI37_9BACT|nr:MULTISPECIES: hypothetical protein [Corallococcus]RKH15523.1 hypothetical protein D7X74_18225 [Corallococcus sp. CA047B]RKH30606.1 hypothetical protein D7X75_20965 [Corallococcus sp. CA031C]RKI08775.1 hypothetical protein D7Y13_15325 [Corallococcus praedator]